MIRTAVIGATGYAGAELVRILAGHPAVRITTITSRQYAGTSFSSVFPSMRGVVDLPCETYDADRVRQTADVAFLALPHKLPMAFVPDLLENGLKVIDLSADFRFPNAARYEAAYQPHTAKHLLKRAVYGLVEVFRDRIRSADLVGNPGCYPTSILLPLYPLVQKGLVDASTVIADAKSGVSGAGRSISLTVHYCEVTDSFKPYKVTGHRHKPEMDEILEMVAGRPVDITFIPHLLPMSRGMESTVYANLTKDATSGEITDCLSAFYRDCPFVRILDYGTPANTAHVRGTNFCDIGFVLEPRKRRIILMSAIDNLVKGAAGQAVQNMNVMFGLAETAGLEMVPYPV